MEILLFLDFLLDSKLLLKENMAHNFLFYILKTLGQRNLNHLNLIENQNSPFAKKILFCTFTIS